MSRSVIGRLLETPRPTFDNFVFRLHYRVTVGLLLICALALLWKINYGLPISCISADGDQSQFLNDHCWYEGTYTVPTFMSKRVEYGIRYPDVDVDRDDTWKQYHNIHLWVVIAVLVQAAFFYFPHMIWSKLESGLVHQLIWNTNGRLEVLRKDLVTNYLKSFSCRNLLYVAGLLLCEILNMTNVVFQTLLIGDIIMIPIPGLDLFIQSGSDRESFSTLSSFPLQTKCDYVSYGTSGNILKQDVNCVMTINGVMVCIFIYMRIWFLLLTLLSVLAIIYSLVTILIPPFRVMRLSSNASLTSGSTVKNVVSQLHIGEYFVLHTLSKNLDPVDTKDILEGLADGMTGK